jgi:cytochrome P450
MDKYISPFGYGSRECIGKNLALLEAQKLCLQVKIFLHNTNSDLKSNNRGTRSFSETSSSGRKFGETMDM